MEGGYKLMRGEWCYYAEYFNPTTCALVIENALAYQKAQTGTIGGESADKIKVVKSIRDGEVIWLPRTEEIFKPIFTKLDDFVDLANEEWFGVDYNREGVRLLQFTIYRGTQKHFYNSHQDTVLVAKKKALQRKLSVTVQLSAPDDYEGGEFEFQGINEQPPKEELRKQGTVIAFPSLLWHSVAPVTKGTRYSLVGWYVGPKWR